MSLCCRDVVDNRAFGILLNEEAGLVPGDGRCNRMIRDDAREVRAARDGGQVVPVSRIPLAADAGLRAIDVCRGSFFPESSRYAHNQRCGGWERYVGQGPVHITNHL